jgi:hypothetical protein
MLADSLLCRQKEQGQRRRTRVSAPQVWRCLRSRNLLTTGDTGEGGGLIGHGPCGGRRIPTFESFRVIFESWESWLGEILSRPFS